MPSPSPSRSQSASLSRQDRSTPVRRVSNSISSFPVSKSNSPREPETLNFSRSEKRSFSSPVQIEVASQKSETGNEKEKEKIIDHESVEERVDLSDQLVPCTICSRKFMKNRLVRINQY
jgi:hypothetical protein